jgi:DNA-binding HxlR family transcriptional regulator
MAKQKPYGQLCPIARTLDLIGDRWTILVLRDLFFGNHRFNGLLRSSPGLTPKVLSQRLKRLEENHLIERRVEDGRPPRTEYHLTRRGYSLAPVLQMIGQWGLDNLFEDEPQLREQIQKAVFGKAPRLIAEDISLKGG